MIKRMRFRMKERFKDKKDDHDLAHQDDKESSSNDRVKRVLEHEIEYS
jgi:hypothetical protein